MSDNNPKQYLRENLKTILPKSWRIDTNRTGDALQAITVKIFQTEIERHPSAPLQNRVVTFELEILLPGQNPEKVYDQVDDEIIELLNALDDMPKISWTSCRKAMDPYNVYLGYVITVQIPFAKEKK